MFINVQTEDMLVLSRTPTLNQFSRFVLATRTKSGYDLELFCNFEGRSLGVRGKANKRNVIGRAEYMLINARYM